MSTPQRRTIAGQPHDLVVLYVESRGALGRPKLVTILYDDDKQKIGGGEQFHTAYVHSSATKKRD